MQHERSGMDFTIDRCDTFGLSGNGTKLGLQLSRLELDEMIGGSIFAQVGDLIWHLCSAHIGIAHGILTFLAEEFKSRSSESMNTSKMELALHSASLLDYIQTEKRGIPTAQAYERMVEQEERFRGSYLNIQYVMYTIMRGKSVLSTDQTMTLAIEFLTRFGFLYEGENKQLQFPSNMHMKIWLYSERDSSRNVLDFLQDDFVATCISKLCAEQLQQYAAANMCNKTLEREIQIDLYRLILPYLPQDVLVTPEWRTNDGKGSTDLLIRGPSIFWLWEILVVEDNDADPVKRMKTLCQSYGSFTGTFKYVLIDFRKNKRVGHESDGFLYVAFEDSYKKALISGLGKPLTTVELSGR